MLFDSSDSMTRKTDMNHRLFLRDCLEIKHILNRLVIDLEPSIGNHDEDFHSRWYPRLEEFSLTLMKDISEFCEKTENETATKISVEHIQLGSSLNNDTL